MGFLTIAFFLRFTLLVAVVTWLATQKTDKSSAEGYYLDDRTLGAITIAGSLLLTNSSTEQIVELSGQVFKEHIMVMTWETLVAIVIVITAIFYCLNT